MGACDVEFCADLPAGQGCGLCAGGSVVVGNAADSLARLSDGIAQVCVTSPPYWGQRDYGIDGQLGLERSLDDYLQELVSTFAGVWRVLREDGTLFLNLGDGYTSGGRSSRAPDRKNAKRELASRPPTPPLLKPKDLLLVPERLGLALQAPVLRCGSCGAEAHASRFGRMPDPDRRTICPRCSQVGDQTIIQPGWYLRSNIVWERPNCQPESAKDRVTNSHERILVLSKSASYYFNQQALPCRNNRRPRSVWKINTQRGRNGHPAPFPPALAAACIALGSKPGDLVLDPFLGSGTTAAVAKTLGRTYCGIELNPSFAADAREHLAQTRPAPDPSAALEDLLKNAAF